MSLQRFGAGESLRHDSNSKVTAAVLRPRMARVLVAIVDDVEFVRRERLLKSRSDDGDAVRCHGHT